jgi:hypothetical protein
VWDEPGGSDPQPSKTVHVRNIEDKHVLPSCFDTNSGPIKYFCLCIDTKPLEIIKGETCLYAKQRNKMCPRQSCQG